MISIASTRQDIIDTVESEVNALRPDTAVYGENVPQQVEDGILVLVDEFEMVNSIEGYPTIKSCTVRVCCFSFTSRQVADEIADAALRSLSGKQNQEFGVITLQGFDNVDYDETFGLFIDVLLFSIPLKKNSLKPS